MIIMISYESRPTQRSWWLGHLFWTRVLFGDRPTCAHKHLPSEKAHDKTVSAACASCRPRYRSNWHQPGRQEGINNRERVTLACIITT